MFDAYNCRVPEFPNSSDEPVPEARPLVRRVVRRHVPRQALGRRLVALARLRLAALVVPCNSKHSTNELEAVVSRPFTFAQTDVTARRETTRQAPSFVRSSIGLDGRDETGKVMGHGRHVEGCATQRDRSG